LTRQAHNYLPALDGMRALSILLVLVSHAWLGHIVPGGLGVTVFFFISGFIITRLMLGEWQRDGRIDVRAFYVRRFFRLTPALVVYVLCCLIAMAVVGARIRGIELAAVFFYFANYYEIFVGFGVGEPLYPLGITWSLAVEEHYYFVYPVLFMLLAAHTRRFLLVLVSACVIALCWRIYLDVIVGLNPLQSDRIYKGTDTRYDSILYGAILAVVLDRFPQASDWLARPGVFMAGLVLLLLTLVIRHPVFQETLRYSLQGLGIMAMTYVAVFRAGWVQRLLSCAPLLYIGKISYSLYLYHWLVLGLVNVYLSELPYVVRFGVLLVVSIIASDLSYRFVEMPGQQWRVKFLGWLKRPA